MSKNSLLLLFTVAVIGSAGYGGYYLNTQKNRPAGSADSDSPVALSAMAKAGKRTFDRVCAACHGANGVGTNQGPPLVHRTYNPGHHADEAFFRAVRNGVQQHHWRFGNMPPQPSVSTRELADVVRYVREMQEANGIFTQKHQM